MPLFGKLIDKRIAAYQRELIEIHYAEVENMYRQIRGWRHDYRSHIQVMKAHAAQGDWNALTAYLDQLETDLSTVDTVVKTGKTTFIKLLCRLYDPTEGEILLNGIDIRKYRNDNYLALFSVVFQDFRLLAQSLGSNVAAADVYDRARAEECLDKAGFGPRLAELPKGLDTCLYREFEDDGVEVSGGEAQKIALARVLYQDAPFIVLDEPTAALDPEAEAEVYTKFNDIVEDKTAIYISHRLSSCRFCDEIAVFDHGQVVQQGRHDSLVEAEGKYRDLWEAQVQYYQKKKE